MEKAKHQNHDLCTSLHAWLLAFGGFDLPGWGVLGAEAYTLIAIYVFEDLLQLIEIGRLAHKELSGERVITLLCIHKELLHKDAGDDVRNAQVHNTQE
eukprot:3613626-Amphidinium_carterae.1